MRSQRARRNTLIATAFLTAAIALPAVAEATTSVEDEVFPPSYVQQADVVYPLTFPVMAPTYYSDTFGACRDGCTRTHTGIDIMSYGWKGVPVVAAHAGTITMTTESAGRDCCAIWGLTADDGWKTMYIHLNNDSPGTDDGNGWGFAPGIEVGTRVEAGELIGWVGDSGNAERVSPHLHFELHNPTGTRINPYESLLAASRTVVPRIEGLSRFDTAVQISMEAFPDGAETVFVGTGFDFPDALAGGPAAAHVGAPVLLSNTDGVPQVTLDEIDRLGATRIIVLGGEGALDANVFDTLDERADEVVRVWGTSRFATAAAVSAEVFAPGTEVVYIANGLTFPDAVSGAPAAARDGAPLLLALQDRIPEESIWELERIQPTKIVVLGGTGVISAEVEEELGLYASSVVRLSGATRYATAAAIADYSHPGGVSKVYLATGNGFVDALAGIALSYRDGAPILLVDDGLPAETATAIGGLGATGAVILGGTSAVATTVDTDLWDLFNDNDMPVWK